MIVGFDRGHSSIKVSYPNDTFIIPHNIGEGRERTLLPNKTTPLNNIDIIIEGKRYFVGELAKECFNSTTVFQKSHIHNSTKVFLLSALAMLPDNIFDVTVGLPIADFRNQKKELSQYLKTDTTVDLCGEKKRITIRNVSVFPQSVGALWSQYLSYTGTLYKEIPKKCGIIDIGFKDMNFAVLENGEFRDNQSWSFPIGLHTAFMASIPELDGDYTINDIEPSIVPQRFYDGLRDKIMNLINPYWGNQGFPIYSTGGGSYNIHIGQRLENPVFANAIGFRKLGVLKYA